MDANIVDASKIGHRWAERLKPMREASLLAVISTSNDRLTFDQNELYDAHRMGGFGLETVIHSLMSELYRRRETQSEFKPV